MKCVPITATMIAQLRALRSGRPLYLFARMLGLSAPTLASALAGEKLHPGTRELLATKIQELTAGEVVQVEGAAA